MCFSKKIVVEINPTTYIGVENEIGLRLNASPVDYVKKIEVDLIYVVYPETLNIDPYKRWKKAKDKIIWKRLSKKNLTSSKFQSKDDIYTFDISFEKEKANIYECIDLNSPDFKVGLFFKVKIFLKNLSDFNLSNIIEFIIPTKNKLSRAELVMKSPEKI